MTFRLSLLIVLITGFVLSCSTGPEFERDNENDPNSSTFSPNPPSGAHFSFTNDTLININWIDNTKFETEYVIKKRVGDNFDEIISTLKPDVESYTDTSKEFGFSTTYIVVAKKNDSSSDSLMIDINFGSLQNLASSLKTRINSSNELEINLTWNDNIHYENGFLLIKNPSENEIGERIKILDPNLEATSIFLPNDNFVNTYKLVPFRVFRRDTTYFDEDYTTTFSIKPKDLEMNLISEDSLLFSWDFDANFHDEFLIYLETENGVESFRVDKGKNQLLVNQNINKDYLYKASVSAIKGNLVSPEISTSKIFKIPPVIIDSIAHVSDSEVILKVYNSSTTSLQKDVYRSTESSNNFVKVGEIPINENTFHDSNLDKNETYKYFISTSLSDNSPTITISYRNGLRFIKSVNIAENDRYIFSDNINRNYNSNFLILQNWLKEQTFLVDYLDYENKIAINYYGYSPEIQAHPEQNIISAVQVNDQYKKLVIINNNVESEIDSGHPNDSNIRSINFLDEKISYLKQRDKDWNIISSSFDGNQKDTLLTFSSRSDLVHFHLNDNKNKLILFKYNDLNEIELQKFRLSGSSLKLDNSFSTNTSPLNYSKTLDSVLVSMSQYNLSVVDLNTSNTVFSFNFNLNNSNSLSKSFFINEDLLYVPDQSSAYLVDIRNQSNPILQTFDFGSSRTSFAGAFFDKQKNYLVDMRRHHTSGIPNFYTVYSLESYWREIEE